MDQVQQGPRSGLIEGTKRPTQTPTDYDYSTVTEPADQSGIIFFEKKSDVDKQAASSGMSSEGISQAIVTTDGLATQQTLESDNSVVTQLAQHRTFIANEPVPTVPSDGIGSEPTTDTPVTSLKEANIKDLTARRVYIGNANYSVPQTAGTIIAEYEVFDIVKTLCRNTLGWQVILSHYLQRFGLRFTVSVSASPYQQGQIIMYYVPPGVEPEKTGTTPSTDQYSTHGVERDFDCFTMYDSVRMKVQVSAEATLVVPFVNYLQFAQLFDDLNGTLKINRPNGAGKIKVAVWNQLGVNSGEQTAVNLQFYLSLEDLKLAFPTVEAQPKGVTNSLTLDEVKQLEEYRDYLMTMRHEKKGDDLVSTALEAAAMFIPRLFDAPDEPVNSEWPCANSAVKDIRFLVNDKAYSPGETRTTASKPIVPTITNYCSTYCRLNVEKWPKDSLVGTRIAYYTVGPNLQKAFRLLAMPKTGELPLWEYWTGDLDFKFEVVKTQFHKGKLAFVVTPPDVTQVDIANLGGYTTLTLDIATSDTVSFRVPWSLGSHWLKIDPAIGIAHIHVLIVSPLVSNNVNDSVDINPYCKVAGNFRVQRPIGAGHHNGRVESFIDLFEPKGLGDTPGNVEAHIIPVEAEGDPNQADPPSIFQSEGSESEMRNDDGNFLELLKRPAFVCVSGGRSATVANAAAGVKEIKVTKDTDAGKITNIATFGYPDMLASAHRTILSTHMAFTGSIRYFLTGTSDMTTDGIYMLTTSRQGDTTATTETVLGADAWKYNFGGMQLYNVASNPSFNFMIPYQGPTPSSPIFPWVYRKTDIGNYYIPGFTEGDFPMLVLRVLKTTANQNWTLIPCIAGGDDFYIHGKLPPLTGDGNFFEQRLQTGKKATETQTIQDAVDGKTRELEEEDFVPVPSMFTRKGEEEEETVIPLVFEKKGENPDLKADDEEPPVSWLCPDTVEMPDVDNLVIGTEVSGAVSRGSVFWIRRRYRTEVTVKFSQQLVKFIPRSNTLPEIWVKTRFSTSMVRIETYARRLLARHWHFSLGSVKAEIPYPLPETSETPDFDFRGEFRAVRKPGVWHVRSRGTDFLGEASFSNRSLLATLREATLWFKRQGKFVDSVFRESADLGVTTEAVVPFEKKGIADRISEKIWKPVADKIEAAKEELAKANDESGKRFDTTLKQMAPLLFTKIGCYAYKMTQISDLGGLVVFCVEMFCDIGLALSVYGIMSKIFNTLGETVGKFVDKLTGRSSKSASDLSSSSGSESSDDSTHTKKGLSEIWDCVKEFIKPVVDYFSSFGLSESHVWEDLRKYLAGLALLGNAVRGIQTVWQLILSVVKWISSFISGPVTPEEKALDWMSKNKEKIKRFAVEGLEMASNFKIATYSRDSHLWSLAHELRGTAKELLQNITPLRNEFTAFLCRLAFKVMDLFRQLPLVLMKTVRTEPVCVWLYGPPGSGKSLLAIKLLQSVCSVIDENQNKNNYFSVTSNTDHWNSFTGKEVGVLMDDVCQSKDNQDMAIFCQMCSSAAFNPPMADLADKSTFFSSKLVVVTANCEAPPNGDFAEKAAALRRYEDNCYKVTGKFNPNNAEAFNAGTAWEILKMRRGTALTGGKKTEQFVKDKVVDTFDSLLDKVLGDIFEKENTMQNLDFVANSDVTSRWRTKFERRREKPDEVPTAEGFADEVDATSTPKKNRSFISWAGAVKDSFDRKGLVEDEFEKKGLTEDEYEEQRRAWHDREQLYRQECKELKDKVDRFARENCALRNGQENVSLEAKHESSALRERIGEMKDILHRYIAGAEADSKVIDELKEKLRNHNIRKDIPEMMEQSITDMEEEGVESEGSLSTLRWALTHVFLPVLCIGGILGGANYLRKKFSDTESSDDTDESSTEIEDMDKASYNAKTKKWRFFSKRGLDQEAVRLSEEARAKFEKGIGAWTCPGGVKVTGALVKGRLLVVPLHGVQLGKIHTFKLGSVTYDVPVTERNCWMRPSGDHYEDIAIIYAPSLPTFPDLSGYFWDNFAAENTDTGGVVVRCFRHGQYQGVQRYAGMRKGESCIGGDADVLRDSERLPWKVRVASGPRFDKGVCGSMATLQNTRLGNPLIGFVSGDAKGVAVFTVVTKEILVKAERELADRYAASILSTNPFVTDVVKRADVDDPLLMFVSKTTPLTTSGFTQLVHTRFQQFESTDWISTEEKIPAKITEKEFEWEDLSAIEGTKFPTVWLSDSVSRPENPCLEDFEIVVETHCDQIREAIEDPLRVLTNHEALNGYVAGAPGFERSMDRLDMTTSAGYSFRKENKSRKDIIDVAEDQNLTFKWDQEIAFNEYCEGLERGEFPNDPFLITPKDELRPVEKVLQGKTRMFYIPGLFYSLACRKYFGDFFAEYRRLPTRLTHSMIGCDPFLDWNAIGQVLGQSLILEYDVRGWDKSNSPYVLEKVRELIENCYEDSTDEEAVARAVLWEMTIYSPAVYKDLLFVTNGGLMSGVPNTAEINCIVHALLGAYALTQDGKGRFAALNRTFLTYGDDGLLRLDHAHEVPAIVSGFRDMGFVVTDANDKTKPPTPSTLEESHFLKRRWKRVDYFGSPVWFPEIDYSTVRSLLDWRREQVPLVDKVEDALEFLFQACDRDTFELVRSIAKVASATVAKAMSTWEQKVHDTRATGVLLSVLSQQDYDLGAQNFHPGDATLSEYALQRYWVSAIELKKNENFSKFLVKRAELQNFIARCEVNGIKPPRSLL